jgi:nitroreductase
MTAIYRRQIGCVPALGFISGSFWKPAEAINAGRFLMHFWLETARQGLYLHPYGNLVTNRRAADSVAQEVSQKDIWFVFKVGYSDEPPKSHRLPLEKILIP